MYFKDIKIAVLMYKLLHGRSKGIDTYPGTSNHLSQQDAQENGGQVPPVVWVHGQSCWWGPQKLNITRPEI